MAPHLQGCFFPGTGSSQEVGKGAGTGYTVNVPWCGPGVSDGDFLAAFQLVVLPLAREFNPDLVSWKCEVCGKECGDSLWYCALLPVTFGVASVCPWHFTLLHWGVPLAPFAAL